MPLAEIYELLNQQTPDREDDDISAYDDSFKSGDTASGDLAEPVTQASCSSPHFVGDLQNS